MSTVLDTGARLAYERGDRTMQALLERAHRRGAEVRTSTGVVAQVWRCGSRQARLARLLRGVYEQELTRHAARRVGLLLAAVGVADVVDAAIIDLAQSGDENSHRRARRR